MFSTLGEGVRGASDGQDTQDRSQLPDRLMACVLDRLKRGARIPRLQPLGRRAGLHVDGRQRVREDVVQLTRDPHPLLLGPTL